MSDGVTVREFARQIGKSHVWVIKLIKEGILPRYTDGSVPLEAGLKAFDEYMAAPKVKRGRPTKSEAQAKANKTKVVDYIEKEEEQQNNSVSAAIPSIEDTPTLSSYNKSQQAKESVAVNNATNKARLADITYKARTRELNYKKIAGQLLERTAVEAEAQWLAEQVKSKLMAIPPRISSMCEGRIARDIEDIITDALNDALKELQKCKYSGDDNK